jgi:hypothetical protein
VSAEIFFYKYLLNPVMRGMLRSPLHTIVSKNIAILHFTGRKSGKAFNTPLSYMREGNTVRFLSSTETLWWQNLRGDAVPVEVEAQRQRMRGTATLLVGDSEALRSAVSKFIAAVPRDAGTYGLKLDDNKQLVEASLATKAAGLVLVEVKLD